MRIKAFLKINGRPLKQINTNFRTLPFKRVLKLVLISILFASKIRVSISYAGSGEEPEHCSGLLPQYHSSGRRYFHPRRSVRNGR